MARPTIQCPAGEIVQPVLAKDHHDAVQCRIQGGLRPAQSSPDPMGNRKPAVCCASYAECTIWKMAQEIERGPSTLLQRRATLALPHSHTIDGPLDRPLIRV